jgi:cytochrome c oxidase subunit 2
MHDWLGLPVAAAAEAWRVDRILTLVHVLMVALFVGWAAFFTYVLIRFRRKSHPKARHEGVRGRWATVVEVGVVVAEVVLLAFFSIPAWSARVSAFPPESGSTVVHVVAEQFAWNVHYAGADGRFGRTDPKLISSANPLGLDRNDPAARDDATAVNELHLPVNRPVIVYLSSKDVVHSFALPQMRVKQDAIPGTVQPVWFTPTERGEWDIACSQLCGLAHYRMKGRYRVEDPADYTRWVESLPR